MNLPVTAIYALTLLWTVLTGAAVVLIAIGVRGRQIDRLGRCRACGYVIHGGFDPSTCPECGMDIRRSGLRFGRRQVLLTPLAFGVMLLAVGVTPVVVMLAQKPKQIVAAAVNTPAQTAAAGAALPSPANGALSGAGDLTDHSPSDRDDASLPVPARGLLDSAGNNASLPMKVPADVVAGVPYDMLNARTSAEPRTPQIRNSARPQRGALDAAALLVADMSWTGPTWRNTWEVNNNVTAPPIIHSNLFAAPLADGAMQPGPLDVGSVAWRIAPLRSSAAKAWEPQSAASGNLMHTHIESTAVNPTRSGSAKRVR